jgi:hypothetical protein
MMTADDEKLASAPVEGFVGVWAGLVVLALLWGWASIGLWNLASWLFGWPGGIYAMQALVLSAVMLLWPYRRASESLVSLLARSDPAGRSLISAVVVVVLITSLTALRPDWYRQEVSLPSWLAWLRPESKIDRVLLLMPLWGAWSMLILPHFRRPDPATNPALAAMSRSCGPMTSAVLMGVLLAMSVGYFAYLPWTQLTISAVGIAAALAGGLYLARRSGQADRAVLLATNLLTQLAILLAVLANRNVRFW